jgi:hypothetical protein
MTNAASTMLIAQWSGRDNKSRLNTHHDWLTAAATGATLCTPPMLATVKRCSQERHIALRSRLGWPFTGVPHTPSLTSLFRSSSTWRRAHTFPAARYCSIAYLQSQWHAETCLYSQHLKHKLCHHPGALGQPQYAAPSISEQKLDDMCSGRL